MTRAAAGPPPVVETVVVARLPGGDLEYTLRRSARARRLRVTIHPERGVVVSLPVAARRGWGRPDALVDRFLAEREDWIRGTTQRPFARWKWAHLRSAETLAQRLKSFGIRAR